MSHGTEYEDVSDLALTNNGLLSVSGFRELTQKQSGITCINPSRPDIHNIALSNTHTHTQQHYLHTKADRLLMCNKYVERPLITDREFQWTGNGHLQLPLAELGKSSPNIDLLRTTGSNGRT